MATVDLALRKLAEVTTKVTFEGPNNSRTVTLTSSPLELRTTRTDVMKALHDMQEGVFPDRILLEAAKVLAICDLRTELLTPEIKAATVARIKNLFKVL